MATNYGDPSAYYGGFSQLELYSWINEDGLTPEERDLRMQEAHNAYTTALEGMKEDRTKLAGGFLGTSTLQGADADLLAKYGLTSGSEQDLAEAIERMEGTINGIDWTEGTLVKPATQDENDARMEELAAKDSENFLEMFKQYYPDFLKTQTDAMKAAFPAYYAAQDKLLQEAMAGMGQMDNQALGGYADQIREAQSARGMATGGAGAFEEAMGRAGFLEQMRAQRFGQLGQALGMGQPQAAQYTPQSVSSYAGLANYNPFTAPFQFSQQNQGNLAAAYPGQASSGWSDFGNAVTGILGLKKLF